jgi:hypothetical protein
MLNFSVTRSLKVDFLFLLSVHIDERLSLARSFTPRTSPQQCLRPGYYIYIAGQTYQGMDQERSSRQRGTSSHLNESPPIKQIKQSIYLPIPSFWFQTSIDEIAPTFIVIVFLFSKTAREHLGPFLVDARL